MSEVRRIVFVEDLLRPSILWPWMLADLLREPILQGTGINLGEPAGASGGCLGAGFDSDRFRSLAEPDERAEPWAWQLRDPGEAAVAYLDSALPDGALVLSFEMPPWLRALCRRRGLASIDLRPSPLRFGRDLHFALRTDDPAMRTRLRGESIADEELRLEAGMLRAAMRAQQARLDEQRRYPLDLAGALVWIGQAPYDASVVADDGTRLRCVTYADRIRDLAKGRRLLHKAHPMAAWHADEERAQLSEIVGAPVGVCLQNAYQILSSRQDVELAGISSGMLQEAAYFDKRAFRFFRAYVPLGPEDETDPAHWFQQVRFGKLASPGFWHRVVSPGRAAPAIDRLPDYPPNHAREISDHWWDYSKATIWERPFWIEAFERSGGGLLRTRIETLERAAASPEGRDFRLHSGERQTGATLDAIRADHRMRYDWADASLPEGARGLDVFCGNGYGTWMLARRRFVVGIDGSDEAIRWAKEHYASPNASYRAARFPFDLPKSSYQFVVSLESLEHVENDEAFFATIVSALTEGGMLVLSVPNEAELPLCRFRNAFHHRHYTIGGVRRLCAAHGMTIIEWAGQDVYAPAANDGFRLLEDESLMCPRPRHDGQFLLFACRKGAG